MNTNHSLGGLVAAVVVLLWGIPSLCAVLLSEPPPKRAQALRAVFEALGSMALGFLSYLGAVSWSADFINAVVEKFLGVNPKVEHAVAAVVVAVVVTGIGPSLLQRLEKRFGRKVEEVLP